MEKVARKESIRSGEKTKVGTVEEVDGPDSLTVPLNSQTPTTSTMLRFALQLCKDLDDQQIVNAHAERRFSRTLTIFNALSR